MTRTLVLLRHGQTAWNATGRAQGHADIGLDELGHAQARAAAPYLSGLRPVALWTSDLLRARETAAYVERATGLEAKRDERLREFDVGDRQGLTMAEFAARSPREHASWVAGDDRFPVRGGETLGDVEARIVPALREALDSLETGDTGIVVTHGAALKVGLTGLLGWPRAHSADLRAISNCGWAIVSSERPALGARLAAYDQRALPEPGVGPAEPRFAST